MDMSGVRRASSAGYRLPERKTQSQTAANRTQQYGGGDAAATAELTEDWEKVPDKQDQLWKELVRRERRGVLEWEKNWNFLRNYDQYGQLKSEEPLPSSVSVSLFSERVPNTSNRTFGSRLSTPRGTELARMERMLLWGQNNRRCKQDPEMVPC